MMWGQVVELEISLDETQEQYKNVLKNSNSKSQERKMSFLTRNLDQLTLVQKQVRRLPLSYLRL
jgi:kinesin family protein 5